MFNKRLFLIFFVSMLKKRNIYAAVFIVSIVGLAIVQYQYLRVGLNLAKAQFNTKMGRTATLLKEELSSNNKLTFLLAEALKEDTSHFNITTDSLKGASRYFLNDFLTEKLVNSGVDTDFTFTLFARDSSYYLSSVKTFDEDEEVLNYPIELKGYLPEDLATSIILELKFKNLNAYFLSKLNGLTLPSLLFILGIIATIIWVLRTYYWQRNVITTTNDFINNLTHELKTPVFSIGLASKMLEADVPDDKKPVLDIIRQQVERLKVHIDKVLELSRLEEKKTVFTLEKVDFKPYLENLCKDFEALSALEETTFTYTLEGSSYMMMAEVAHLENAIHNILDNARKYSDQPMIHLKGYCSAAKLCIEIQDNGKGIAEQDKNKVFQKYFRVTNGNTHAVKGYGLGLNYVKNIVDRHKGKVHLHSEINKGTLVTIQIPLLKNGA